MTTERRSRPRIALEAFAKDMLDAEPTAGSGVIFRLVTNVCEEGLFVVDRLQSLDDAVRLELPIGDGGQPVEIRGKVVRRTEDGAGVRFLTLAAADRARLGKLCADRTI
ncbi:MAG: PilZ domain-containing protein [Deltaproteobacteria bacterium]|nr:PilZ domain-containing protein [Deltaproteobacteria bacterium]